jgi:sulfur-oxidizing protein SoxY
MRTRGTPSRLRRRLLLLSASVAGAAIVPARAAPDLPARSAATALPGIRALAEYLAGREPRFERLTLEVPRIADNGNAVPLHLALAGPFPAGGQARSIRLFSEKNPYPLMAMFEFPAPLPTIELDSRIRLAGSQRIAAIAETADGALYAAVADISVTIAACLDGT